MTPDQLNEIEAKAALDLTASHAVPDDVLALVARVRELEAERDAALTRVKIYLNTNSAIDERLDLSTARAEKAEARVKELECENCGGTGKVLYGDCAECTLALKAERDHLKARVAVLREALDHYGDMMHWDGDAESGCGAHIDDGALAREALATLDPAATALTERLKAAMEIGEWVAQHCVMPSRIEAAWRKVKGAT